MYAVAGFLAGLIISNAIGISANKAAIKANADKALQSAIDIRDIRAMVWDND